MKPGNIEIEVELRDTGRHNSRMLRASEMTPGVVYGTGVGSNLHFRASEKMIRKYASQAYENTIFTLKSKDTKLNNVKVLLKEMVVHPVSRRPVHVDLWAIDLNKPVRVHVEVRFEGKAIGLSEGGVLQPLLREIEVECLPAAIPEFLMADVSQLGIHDTLHISDLKMPSGVKSVSHDDLAIVTVTVIKEEVATPVAAAGATTTAEPEVIGKGKKPEDGAEGAASKDSKAPAAGGDKAGSKK